LASHIADDLAYARRLVEATLERLGPAAQGLHILDISTTEPVTPPRPGLQTCQHLRITVGPGPDLAGPDTIGAHFSMTVPRDQATLATVDQVQEHVIETFYVAVPPCPDHQHPLRTAVLDGVPSWVCPVDVAHHAEPILT
jgi:hypothetical protein